jgi:phosphoribosylformylglycinamidine cyclo-ligase
MADPLMSDEEDTAVAPESRVPTDYKSAGVDIDAGHEAVRRIRALARGTFTSGVLSDIGSFGGLFRPDLTGLAEPVLVSSADGVGTKLKVAFRTGRHDSVGVDLVNHCVNDILVQGATPLFFLDYLATGALSPDVAAEIVTGLAAGCTENGCALLGGETAEMPGFYAAGEYDLAGFVVGLVDRARVIDGRRIKAGDCLIGLRSSGLHTNGYSLARHVIFDRLGLATDATPDGLDGAVGEVLLRPHRSYLRSLRALLAEADTPIKGMAHITGGGLTDNLPRVLPDGTAAEIDRASWTPPPIFGFLQHHGAVPESDAFRAFNMGIGMVVVCGAEAADVVLQRLHEAGETDAVVIGAVTSGDGVVTYR